MRNLHQTITIDGQKAVVLSIADYENLRSRAEMLDDIESFDAAMARLVAGEETFPKAVADRLLAGDSPVRVFREYRALTQKDLALAAGISTAAISKIESGGNATVQTLVAIAGRLGVTVDDLV